MQPFDNEPIASSAIVGMNLIKKKTNSFHLPEVEIIQNVFEFCRVNVIV